MYSHAYLQHRANRLRLSMIPEGAIVAWEGLIADIPQGWALCDGNADTPDLADRFVLGKDASHDGPGGSDFSAVGTPSMSTEGSHTLAYGERDHPDCSSGSARHVYADGGHAHTISGLSVDYTPPSYKLAYLMAAKAQAKLPAGAVVWHDGTDAPDGGGYQALADVQNRFILASIDDSRGPVGSDDAVIIFTGLGTAGAHIHGPHDCPLVYNSGSKKHCSATAGAHNHGGSISGSKTMSKPPYIGLLTLRLQTPAGLVERIILAYYGDLADLPFGWHAADGDGGTIDCRGRIPIGIGAGYTLGDVGGDMDNVSGSMAITGLTAPHTHETAPVTKNTNEVHMSYNWPHQHTVTFECKKQVPWYGLHFIEFIV